MGALLSYICAYGIIQAIASDYIKSDKYNFMRRQSEPLLEAVGMSSANKDTTHTVDPDASESPINSNATCKV